MPTLAEMRLSFRRRASQLADDLPNGDADVDAYLNHAYQWRIPDEIPGQLTEGTWDLNVLALKAEYDFPNWVHSVKGHVRLGNSDLAVYARESEFWRRHDPEDANTGRPVSVLVNGRKLRFHRIPAAEETATIVTRNYPNAAGPNPGDPVELLTLPVAGLDWFQHSDAVVWGALEEFAADFDLDSLLAKSAAGFAMRTSKMRSRSLTRPRGRASRRTF